MAPLGGREWLASLHSRLTAGERVPVTHWIGGWVGLRAGLDALAKRESHFSALTGNRTPSVTIKTELPQLKNFSNMRRL